MKKLVLISLICLMIFFFPTSAIATPLLISPGNGQVVSTNQPLFMWADDYSQNPYQSYLLLSTSPETGSEGWLANPQYDLLVPPLQVDFKTYYDKNGNKIYLSLGKWYWQVVISYNFYPIYIWTSQLS